MSDEVKPRNKAHIKCRYFDYRCVCECSLNDYDPAPSGFCGEDNPGCRHYLEREREVKGNEIHIYPGCIHLLPFKKEIEKDFKEYRYSEGCAMEDGYLELPKIGKIYTDDIYYLDIDGRVLIDEEEESDG